MPVELSQSVGTCDDSFKLTFQAKQIATLVGAPDGMIIRISSTEFGIIKYGVIHTLDIDDIPETFILAYSKAESMENPPRYPYTLVIKEPK